MLGDFEGLGEHLVVDVGREQSCSDLLDPWVLAAQGCDGHGRVVADVQLEVDQALGKHEHISLVQGGGEQGVVGGAHESHVQGALGQKQDLGGPGVGVGHVDTSLGEVDARHGDAQRVEACEVVDVGSRHRRRIGVVGVACFVE